MTHRHNLEALDITLQDMMTSTLPFERIFVLFTGEFR